MKEIKASVSFIKKNYKVEFIEKLIRKYLTFNPDFIEITTSEDNTQYCFEGFDFGLLDNDSTINIFSENGESLYITYPAHKNSSLTMYYSLKKYYDLISIIERMYEEEEEKFIVAYIYDDEFVFWQSAYNINTFKHFGKSYKKLPKTFDPFFEEEIVDISKNPGRRMLVSEMWLLSTWIMFFGEYFFQFVPKQRLLSFPYAFEIKELPSGAVFIKLYDDVTKSDEKENLKIMQLFREWINLDQLEKQLE